MKKNLIKDSFYTYFSKALTLFLVTTCANNLHAQVQNNGTVYVGQNAILHTNSVFTFGTGSITKTLRTSGYGKITFGTGASANGSASGAALFVDGYANTRSAAYFELPTGQGTTYAPIGVTNFAVTNGVDAAFYDGALTSTVADATIQTLPSSGYWDVKGDNAILTLKWNSSIVSLTNSIANLTVAGLIGTTWVAIPSEVATGSLSTGAIATSAAVNLATYSAFTLAEKGITCAPLVANSGLTSTWSGTAWDTTPTLADAAVLAGPYPSNAGSFVCNSLNIGTNAVTLADGQTIEVVNEITGTGTITMSSTASVMQRNDASIITPNIILTKSSRVNMRANDYIYWGSPLTTDSFSQLDGARAYDATNVLTGTAAAFDSKYAYAAGIMGTAGGWQPLGATTKGQGFIMRIKDQAPYSAATPYSGYINLTFTGSANNGLVNVPTANVNATSTTSARNNNLLANPYPSAIDADKFLEYNTTLDGVIYLWRATTPNLGTSTSNYAVGDYIAYTRAGTTGISGINATFNGKIATGQGFKVKAIDTAPTGTATFNNCMRVSGNNTQFMKMSSSATTTNIDRFNVNITHADGTGNQILVAYMPDASLAYDRMYDASLNTVSPLQMYSILDSDTKKLAINARPVFDVNDQVAVGFKKETTDAAILSINVAQKEGVFASTTPIYLHDTVLNVYHNFNDGAYSFATTATEDNSRFKIVYQGQTLSNNQLNAAAVIANIKNNTVTLTANAPMVNFAIFDLTGKKLYESKIQNATSFSADFNHAQALYIAKVTLENGSTANIKLINQK